MGTCPELGWSLPEVHYLGLLAYPALFVCYVVQVYGSLVS